MTSVTVVMVVAILTLLCPPHNCQPKDKELFEKSVTAQAVVETLFKTLNKTHRFTIKNSVEYYVKFTVPEKVIKRLEKEKDKHIFQVNVETGSLEEKFPLDVTVRQHGRLTAFQIPTLVREGDRIVYSSNKRSVDLCPLDVVDDNSTVTLSLSTDSTTPIKVKIRVLVKGRVIDWRPITDTNGQAFTSFTTISPSISRIRFFDTKLLETDSIIVKIQTRNGSDCMCSLISIQKPVCPFHDDIGGAMRFGVWSTVLEQGTVILDPDDWPDGFIIVQVASADPGLCGTNCDNGNKTSLAKKVRIIVGSNGSDSDYALATLAVIAFYLVIIFLTISVSAIQFKYKYSDFENVREIIEEKIKEIGELTNNIELPPVFRKVSEGHTLTDGLKLAEQNIGQISEVIVGEVRVEQSNDLISFRENKGDKNPLNRESLEFIDTSEACEELSANEVEHENIGYVSDNNPELMLASIEDIKEFDVLSPDEMRQRRTASCLFVSDLSRKLNDPTRTKSVYQKSQLYLGVLFLISMFYSLPVLQMVFSFSYEQGVTGNQDICYYNDLCRKPLGLVRDFNHVFSNLGYCVFGLLFMCIVLFQQMKYKKFLKDNQTIRREEFGVPSQYGLYFSLGLALFMEGIMSACYHICPTNITFQFDTTFMYLIAVLMFIKLYQIRHADVSANAIGVFFGLGVALFLETFSIYYNGPGFWALFCLVYIIVIVVVSVHAYNIGVVKYDYKILFVVTKILVKEVKHWFIKSDSSERVETKAKPRLICLIVIAAVNIILCLVFGISGTPGASNYLLAIFFLNLALYGCYYCTMKIIHGERLHRIPLIYAFLGLVCFLPSLYFFTQKEKMTELSPSESREMNRECVFLNFYDGHDIWHFLGAAGVFFAFLFILTIDEDVKGKKRNTIKVF